MGIIIWLVVGGIVGWLASLIMRTDGQQGIILNVVVGIVGAVFAGLVLGKGNINGGLTIETFLLDALARDGGGQAGMPVLPSGETPSRIRVEFLRRVRAERKFETPDALRAQILKDVRTAHTWFRRVAAWTGMWTDRACISC